MLARMEAEEAIPDLTRLLEEGGAGEKILAARALAELGRADGARVLFRSAAEGDASALLALNALRAPAAWRRLQETALPEFWVLPARGAWEAAARAAGLKLDVPGDPGWVRDPDWPRRRNSEGWSNSFPVAAEGLEALLAGRPYAVILEEDRLRVVPRADALSFWRAWSGP